MRVIILSNEFGEEVNCFGDIEEFITPADSVGIRDDYVEDLLFQNLL